MRTMGIGRRSARIKGRDDCQECAPMHLVLAAVDSPSHTTAPRVHNVAMTVPKQIASFIRENKGKAFCDDCLYVELRLSTRQQAQVYSAAFAETSDFNREKGNCSRCHEDKVVIYAN